MIIWFGNAINLIVCITQLYGKEGKRILPVVRHINSLMKMIVIEQLLKTDQLKLVIVFGWGQGVKNKSNLGKQNNQNFVAIPTSRLKNRIQELAESVGIRFTETEEAYTSKSDYFSGDLLPIFGEKADATEPSSHGGSHAHQAPNGYKFSGKRINRGTYRTAQGWLINCDSLGALNAIKKVAIQLGINLAEVGREALTLPKRYTLNCLKKVYRKRSEAGACSRGVV